MDRRLHPLGVDLQAVLMSQVVQVSAALHMPLRLQRRLGDERRPGLRQHMAQLEAALAIHVILKIALAELKRLR